MHNKSIDKQRDNHISNRVPQTYYITHFNVVYAPDLSNRTNLLLYPRPLSDVDILKVLMKNIPTKILHYHRSENQKDRFSVDFINKRLINDYNINTDKLSIDFSQFKNQSDRMAYIMGRNGIKKDLSFDINELIKEYSRINNIASKQNFGADVWTYLNEGIDDKFVLGPEKPIMDEGISYCNTYRNILIMTTDGYIEAGIYGKGIDLSKNTIDQFRKAFLKSGESDIKTFFNKNKKFRIKPVNNPYLNNLEILVLELYDRSKTIGGAATVQPTDMEIIKLFWSDWLKNSKVKKFELHPIANSKEEVEKSIISFLGVNN